MIVDTTAIIVDLVHLCHQRHGERAMLFIFFFSFFVRALNGAHICVFWVIVTLIIIIAGIAIIAIWARLQVAEPTLVLILEESLHQLFALIIQ